MLTLPNHSDAALVDLVDEMLTSVISVCETLPADAWDRPTDCPAWSVRDVVAHLADFEVRATGGPPAPPIDRAAFPHVKNDFQEMTERGVQARRGRTGPEVLEELREASAARLAQLRALDEAGWEGNVELPVGSVPQRKILPMRITDLVYHEQDIRRATGRPGHLDGAAARYIVERMAALALPLVVAKSAGAPEGTTVRWTVDGPAGLDVTVGVRGGRGVLEEPAAEPTVTFSSDVETFLCLFGGRWTAERARTEGQLKVDGDEAIAETILAKMTVIP